MGKKRKRKKCETCGQVLLDSVSKDQVIEQSLEAEEQLIARIKEKAIKATMEAIRPLLDKLEAASKAQVQQEVQPIKGVGYESSIQKMQEVAQEKMQARQKRLQEKMKSLEAKIAKKL